MSDELKAKIIRKVKNMVILEEPQLAFKSYRVSMGLAEKIALVTKMMRLANKIEIING